MQFLKNPFYIYFIAFTVILGIYLLGWSNLYPNLSGGLLVFVILSSLISVFLGGVIDKYNPIVYQQIKPIRNLGKTTIIVYALLVLEFIYNKGIPLLLVFSDSTYKYEQFGIPFLHPLLATFVSFYTVYIFHAFLSVRKTKYILYLILFMAVSILIYNRGMFLINLTSCLFVYFSYIKRIKVKIGIFVFAGVLLLLFGFGVMGNYRLIKKDSNEYFLNESKASDKFINSTIPKEYMWSYMYISSPLANLQNTINTNPPINFRIKDFVFTEIIPDFISKRVSSVVNAEQAEINRISGFLTVGTLFSKPYVLLGWLGIYLIFFISILFTFFYILLLKRTNKYYVTGIAILCSYTLFNMFSNMIYFSGVSFQLIYPLILGMIYFKRGKFLIKLKQ